MELKRTDGQGTYFDTQRLLILKSLIDYYEINFIEELHDHKGCLTVFWYNEPTDQDKDYLESFWNILNESDINHIVKINTDKIYLDLFSYLNLYYPNSCNMNKENLINVDSSSSLFNYTEYEFNGKLMEDFELTKIVKKFHKNFYCEWNDVFSQIICID